MKRCVLAVAVAALVGAAPALADAGAPGSTFPEQPGTNVATACSAVISNPGTGIGGAASPSPTGGAIVNGIYTDACAG